MGASIVLLTSQVPSPGASIVLHTSQVPSPGADPDQGELNPHLPAVLQHSLQEARC